MNLKQFQEESKRTMPFNGEPQNHIEFENMLGNYAMGLVGEYIEMMDCDNEEDLTKEIGDVMHYGVGLLELLDEKVDIELFGDVDEHEGLLAAGTVLELAKKHIYHRHELPKSRMIELIYEALGWLRPRNEQQVPQFNNVLQMNIDKLKTRYPESFTVEDSIARKDVE